MTHAQSHTQRATRMFHFSDLKKKFEIITKNGKNEIYSFFRDNYVKDNILSSKKIFVELVKLRKQIRNMYVTNLGEI